MMSMKNSKDFACVTSKLVKIAQRRGVGIIAVAVSPQPGIDLGESMRQRARIERNNAQLMQRSPCASNAAAPPPRCAALPVVS